MEEACCRIEVTIVVVEEEEEGMVAGDVGSGFWVWLDVRGLEGVLRFHRR